MLSMFNAVLSNIKDGIREIQSVVYGGDNVTLYDVSPWGIDAQPPKNARGVCDREGRFVVGYRGVDKTASDGELRVYATDKSGNVVSEVHLFSSGKIAVNKGTQLELNVPVVFNKSAKFNDAIEHNGDFKSSGGSFTHNDVNIGSTHKHAIKSGSSAPGPTDVPQ